MSKLIPGKAQRKTYHHGPSFTGLMASGSDAYKRRLHLQHLLPLTPAAIDDPSQQNCLWIIKRLARALRQERTRGKNAHWAYSLNRHIALLQAYRGECKYLEKLKR